MPVSKIEKSLKVILRRAVFFAAGSGTDLRISYRKFVDTRSICTNINLVEKKNHKQIKNKRAVFAKVYTDSSPLLQQHMLPPSFIPINTSVSLLF